MKNPAQARESSPQFALFSYGFRPFFLLAGLYAFVAIATWLWILTSGATPALAMPSLLWHAHEMLYGFIAAAIAGFMLTAVPSWTGSRGFAGAPLIVLTLTWLAGRVAFALSGHLRIEVLFATELLFLPALALLIAPSLLRSSNRNRPLLLVLLAFWLLDLLFLIAVRSNDIQLARKALYAGIDLVMLLITVIGGRIVPAFTANALRAKGLAVEPRNRKAVEWLVTGSMLAIVVAELCSLVPQFMAALAAIACIAQLARLAGWQSLHTLSDPIVWSLHAGYAWLPVGLGLRALYLLGEFQFATHWLHALSAGAAAMMILAVMTRASLGHTGRALKVSKRIAWAYGLTLLAGVTRVFGPAVLPLDYLTTVALASALWLSAFLLFLIVYVPILVRPRADGKPG